MARKFFYAVAALVVCLAAGWLILNRQLLVDRWQLRHYQPPAEVAALATRLDLTDYAQRLFYLKDPQLQTAWHFNRVCPERESSSLVLGCYTGQQIHIFMVDDPRLDGVEEVTAAHEILHVAYERLSGREKANLKIWLSAVKEGLTNQRIKKAIELYANLPQEQLYNELHSIFATEIRGLPDWLEDYYSRYFNQRLSIVALSETYDATFNQLSERVDELDAQLRRQAEAIEQTQTSLDHQLELINNQRAYLSQLLESGEVGLYNASIDGFNQQIDDYFNDSNQLQAKIDDYNQLVEERNAISLEQNDLSQSLNSRHQTDQDLSL